MTVAQVRALTHPDDRAATAALARVALDPKQREKATYEYRIVRPDGEVRWVVAHGEADKASNPLKQSPHTAKVICADEWTRPYSRELAAFPDRHTRQSKFWPSVGRVDNVYGDRNLVCSCAGMEAYAETATSEK